MNFPLPMVKLPLDGLIPAATGPVTPQPYRFAALHCPWPMPLVVRRDWHPEGHRIGLHQHVDFYSLYLVRGGRGVHEINGHPYGLARGDAYLMAPGAQHMFREYSNLETDTFHFRAALFGGNERVALQEISGLLGALFVPPGPARLRAADAQMPTAFSHRLHLLPGRYDEVQARVERIRVETAQPTPLRAILVRHLFFDLLVFLARTASGDAREQTVTSSAPAVLPASANEPPDANRLAGLGDALEFLEQNFTRRLSVAELASRLFLTPDHFSRLFAQHFGVNPGAYIRRLRLARAQDLLRATALSMEEIALQSGFSGGSRLAEAFQSTLGMTPGEYRAQFAATTGADATDTKSAADYGGVHHCE